MASEYRHDPLTDRWVVIAPARQSRKQETKNNICPFCPGNEHLTPPTIAANYQQTSWRVRVVPNKYPALTIEAGLEREGVGIYDRVDGYGAHEVIIENSFPEHKELNDVDSETAKLIFGMCLERMIDLERNEKFRYILLYKNYGQRAGATLAHPHIQLNALCVTPNEVSRELERSRKHHEEKRRCLLCDILKQEKENASRVVLENDCFLVFVPYASRFPGEMIIAPKKKYHSHNFLTCAALIDSLSRIFQEALQRLKLAFDSPAYNWVLHTAPFFRKGDPVFHGQTIEDDFHWHFHIFPRMNGIGGFELGAEFFINTTVPEETADLFRKTILKSSA